MTFFTKYRIWTIVLGVVLGGAFLFTGYHLDSESLLRDFWVNLSASAMAIPLVVLVVDLLRSEERKSNNAEVTALAVVNLNHTLLLLLHPLAELYKLKLPSVAGVSEIRDLTVQEIGKKFTGQMKISSRADLAEKYIWALEHARPYLEEVVRDYAYVLPDEARGITVKLYKQSQNYVGMLAIAQGDTQPTVDKDLLTAFYPLLFKDLKKLAGHVKALEG